MADAKLDEIITRRNTASPGPWAERCESGEWWLQDANEAYIGDVSQEWSVADMFFARDAWADIGYLLDVIMQLESNLDVLRRTTEADTHAIASYRAEAARLRGVIEASAKVALNGLRAATLTPPSGN